jgi:threonine dehydratase
VITTVDRAAIEATHARIRPYVRVTPVVELSGADFGLAPFALVLKLEQLQHSGSFKARGAFANLLGRVRSLRPALRLPPAATMVQPSPTLRSSSD